MTTEKGTSQRDYTPMFEAVIKRSNQVIEQNAQIIKHNASLIKQNTAVIKHNEEINKRNEEVVKEVQQIVKDNRDIIQKYDLIFEKIKSQNVLLEQVIHQNNILIENMGGMRAKVNLIPSILTKLEEHDRRFNVLEKIAKLHSTEIRELQSSLNAQAA
jgi:hypothetical protein